MTRFRFSLYTVLLGSFVACHPDAVTSSPVVPMAGIHFVNAVPDTAKMDFRVVDIVSNAGLFGAPFRTGNQFYLGIQSGARNIRVFYDTSDVAVAQTVFSDIQSTFATNTNYTFLEEGFARGGAPARTVNIITDGASDPGANVGYRIIHAGAGMGGLDVYLIHHQSDTLTLSGPVATNITFNTVSAYGAVPPDTQTQTLRIVATATGTTSPIVVNVAFPPGLAGSTTTNPIAGSQIAGSVMTAIIVPASVAGTKAPQGGAFATPSAVILVDRRPANTAP